MLSTFKMRLAQVVQAVRVNGWRFVFKEVLFLNRTAIVVEKDLSEVSECSQLPERGQIRAVEFSSEVLSGRAYRFADQSRSLKAQCYLGQGLGGFALVRDNVIIGDMWHYVSEATSDPRELHEDLQRFGFTEWRKDYVYLFDLIVVPEERRAGISAFFQRECMRALRARGYARAYGFYWADNIPARWCTRVTNGWKELRAYHVSRFLVFKRAVPVRLDESRDKRTRMDRGDQPLWSKNASTGEQKEPSYGTSLRKSESGL